MKHGGRRTADTITFYKVPDPDPEELREKLQTEFHGILNQRKPCAKCGALLIPLTIQWPDDGSADSMRMEADGTYPTMELRQHGPDRCRAIQLGVEDRP